MATDFTEETAADAVIESFGPQTDPRLREILTALVKHLHGFAREVELTMIGSCFALNSKPERFATNVSGEALWKCIGSRFATEEILSGISCDLPKSLRN